MKFPLLICALAISMHAAPIKVLIVDGQNNHNWRAMTPYMKAQLEKTALFTVAVSTTPQKPPAAPTSPELKAKAEAAAADLKKQFAAQWDAWNPNFSKYDVVISNYNGADWPKPVQESLEKYMREGGRFVCVHAADNSFPEWKEYNQMIGLGGWGGRTERHGPYVYYDDAGKLQRDTTKGSGGSHGPQHEFTIQIRNAEHPITKGMPAQWKHAQDELYDSLRGPAENMEVLASAWCGKTKRHEPMMMVIKQGKGITFHTPMGHENGKSLQCVGFITTLNRACEWLATGKVTLPIPTDFPTAEKVSTRN
ncbi:MAG: ThuA domain-containing protein [Pedosphaera sp.]|nr:ThuA domain-containing protein [Pedosphaera sp.]